CFRERFSKSVRERALKTKSRSGCCGFLEFVMAARAASPDLSRRTRDLSVHDFQAIARRQAAALLRLAEVAVLVLNLELINDRRLFCRDGNDCLPAVADPKRWTHRVEIISNHHERL